MEFLKSIKLYEIVVAQNKAKFNVQIWYANTQNNLKLLIMMQ